MALVVPVSLTQIWAFLGLSLAFAYFLVGALSRRAQESNAKSDSRSRRGIFIQSIGIALAGFGPTRPTLPLFSPAAVVGTVAVIVLMGGAVALFAGSSRALGQNWSLVARTRSDHRLITSGPYAYVRHPIYLGMLLFLLGLAVAFGHWISLVLAIPTFLMGTRIRTKIEERLLDEGFGDEFRDYRRSTPALFPKVF